MPRPILPVLLALPLAACLESEEELTVHPDGSVSVTLSVDGDVADLTDGHPLPLHGPWRPADEATREWAARVGATGGPAARAALESGELPWTADEKRRLAVSAELASVDALPRTLAPPEEAYREAYLGRTSRLVVRELGARRVYVFERAYEGRDNQRFDPWKHLERHLSEELRDALEEDLEGLDEAQWRETFAAVRATFGDVAESLVRDALLPLYTEGDAGLHPNDLQEVVATARAVATALCSDARLEEVRRFAEDDREGLDPSSLEQELQDAVRTALERGLLEGGAGAGLANAALERLELRLTAVDQDADLEDEDHTLRLALPGRIVGGNFDALGADGRARWTVDGKRLTRGGVLLRAVSVLE